MQSCTACSGIHPPHHGAKVTVLAELITHHVNEEEKRSEGLLAQAKAASLDMAALAEQPKQRAPGVRLLFCIAKRTSVGSAHHAPELFSTNGCAAAALLLHLRGRRRRSD